jgi:hypothetical protein
VRAARDSSWPDPYFEQEKWRRVKAARSTGLEDSDALWLLVAMIEEADPLGAFQISDEALCGRTAMKLRTLSRAKTVLFRHRVGGQPLVVITHKGHYIPSPTGSPIRSSTKYRLGDALLVEPTTRQLGM